METKLVPARAALEDWQFYEKPLSRQLRRSSHTWKKYSSDWVRRSVRAGLMHVVDSFDDEGSRCGFMLLTVDTGGNCRTLILFMAYIQPGGPGVTSFWPELRRWARRFNCQMMEFVSSRPGAWKMAEQWGWTERCRVFSAEV